MREAADNIFNCPCSHLSSFNAKALGAELDLHMPPACLLNAGIFTDTEVVVMP